MDITVMNGAPFKGNLDSYIVKLQEAARERGHVIDTLTLRDMNIAGCLGCFGCWVKTPGRCLNPDDSETVCRAIIRSDLILYASPVIMGFISATLKNALDRTIPLIMPYMKAVNGETHHVLRYAKTTNVGFLVEPNPYTDSEDLAIIRSIANRNTYNFDSILRFFETTDTPVGEVANAIDDI